MYCFSHSVISWTIFIGRPVHQAIHAVKCISSPRGGRGGREQWGIRTNSGARLLSSLPSGFAHPSVCIPARCFTKCTHCTGFNHPTLPPGGRTSSFGTSSAPHRDNAACFTRHEKKRGRVL